MLITLKYRVSLIYSLYLLCLSLVLITSGCNDAPKSSQADEDNTGGFTPTQGNIYVAYKLANDSVEYLGNDAITNEFKIYISKFSDSRRTREANDETGQEAVTPNFALDSLTFEKVYPLKLSDQNWYLVSEVKHLNQQDKMLIAASLIWKADSLMIDPEGTLYTCLVKSNCKDPEFKIVNKKIEGFMEQDKLDHACEPYISIQTHSISAAVDAIKETVDEEVR